MNIHAQALGRLGGKAGTGESKRRSPEHYRRLSRLGVATRLKKWAAQRGGKRAIKSLKRKGNLATD